MHCVQARCDEGVGLALIAVDHSADALVLVDTGHVHQLIVGFGSFVAN